MIKAILFDIDGVLIDSKIANRIFYQDILQNSGFKRPTKTQADKVFGLTLHDGIKTLITEKSIIKINKIMKIAKTTRYRYDLLQSTDQNAGKVIAKLHKKYRLGIVTGRLREDIDEIIPFLGIENPFELVVTYEDYSKPKPDPEPLIIASEKLKLPPNQCIYVGDLDTDIEAAKAAGMKYILYSKKTKKSSNVAQTFGEIMDIVEKLD